MAYRFSPEIILHYFLKKESTQFFVSVAIRYLAIGLVGIYEPIYIYLFFNKSITFSLLFWASIYGLFALLAVWAGKIMGRLGLKHSMLVSHFFFFGYYLSLFFLKEIPQLILPAILLRVAGMTFFWPAFHTAFVRFSQKDHRAVQVGKLNAIAPIASIISPIAGGLILQNFGYLVLFIIVMFLLLASAFPLFLSKERHEVYTDTYNKAWQRILKNKKFDIGFASRAIESSTNMFIWPIFMFILGINYERMGEITSFALLLSALFALYMGKLTDKEDKERLVGIGSVLLSLAWIIKCFVKDTLSAFLAHNFHRIAITSATTPFLTIVYDEASTQKDKADEFIVYRSIVLNLTKLFYFLFLALVFCFIKDLRFAFIIASIASLCLIMTTKRKLSSLR